jgi:putative heme-binding domain-containing protein
MPRIGSHEVDVLGTKLIGDWIAQMSRPTSPKTGESLATEDIAALKTLRDGVGATPTVRAETIRRLCGSTRGALALVRSIDRGEVPEAVLREAVPQLKAIPVAEVRDLFERFVPESDRIKRLGDAIDPAAILALAGDAQNGRTLFFAETATQCKSCHRVGGVGIGLGPELDAIGAKYPKPDLLRHILEPSREIDPKFAALTIATKDGQVHIGLLREKTAEEIVLQDAQDRPIRIRIADIEQQATAPTSFMPNGLLRDLTAQQAADLLEFLASLKKK